jgi:GNAT superfamily N-acetyltransferase
VASEKIVFEDKLTTAYRAPGAVLRKREPEGDWMLLEGGGEVAATGVLYHYNRPYGDIWMEVAEPFRGRGFGTYLVQELERICREAGACHVRAAIRAMYLRERRCRRPGLCRVRTYCAESFDRIQSAYPRRLQVTQVVQAAQHFPPKRPDSSIVSLVLRSR